MQAGFTFNKRDDRNSFEKSLYELKMSFDDIIRGISGETADKIKDSAQ